ncbi:MAG TPA: sugar phosphate nucleotidyltransferase [Candidatus Ratteibacteria bacterium]|jgi:glucose-1-phosphate thymidylyltransferase|uniref:UTP--glucose-1-phosphate uridylyltransferase n=1 Tax=candidate division TA06 bacterium ADurb.Bin131 TaxID=1852827 RepID=A0A1V6C9R1_UNCT6|nr:MAG: UTP--glucose-1-phosphate uridylyltransferase [candidate division TA06 bacterium ADurb.Bin131]HOC02525.1 sugar phosphate nucleotidyltransferase [bacterium]HRS06301.1 sugar phosphate nucleotidyltransferase [Candidatus Ratteibacteria bacterium]HON05224.1 sugar phosphate nucleotidyltransferase [bacterium]HPC28681.1 sugar phosphate nucleotidyltransferase [bacterium]
MKEITCILPVAGIGKRLQPHTFTIPKVLFPVAGKPILGYLLDFVKSLGIYRVIFIIGHLGDKIIDYVNAYYPDIEGIFIKQEEFLGLGYAISLAADYVDGPVFINLGDTIIEADIKHLIQDDTSWIAVKEVDDPRRFGVVLTDGEGLVTKVVEKPTEVISRHALCGVYFFNNSRLLFNLLKDLIASGKKTRNEFQLTDAIGMMIEKGEKILAIPAKEWLDCGRVETLLQTNRFLLEKYKPSVFPIPSVVINHPVFIDPSAQLKNCVVGPFVSVGKNVIMSNVIVQNSIINDSSTVKNIVLTDSVIGYSAFLSGNLQKINLGDASQVSLMGEEEGLF